MKPRLRGQALGKRLARASRAQPAAVFGGGSLGQGWVPPGVPIFSRVPLSRSPLPADIKAQIVQDVLGFIPRLLMPEADEMAAHIKGQALSQMLLDHNPEAKPLAQVCMGLFGAILGRHLHAVHDHDEADACGATCPMTTIYRYHQAQDEPPT